MPPYAPPYAAYAPNCSAYAPYAPYAILTLMKMMSLLYGTPHKPKNANPPKCKSKPS